MMKIDVISNLEKSKLQADGVFDWPIWEKEVSSFPWHYDSTEECYILEGRVTVTPEGGEAVTVGAGDFVTFPAGMSCHWDITEAIRKHYNFR